MSKINAGYVCKSVKRDEWGLNLRCDSGQRTQQTYLIQCRLCPETKCPPFRHTDPHPWLKWLLGPSWESKHIGTITTCERKRVLWEKPLCMCCCIPIWSPNKGVSRTGDGGGAKICQFHLPRLRQQDVSCLDVSVRRTRRNHYSSTQTGGLKAQAVDAQHAPKHLKHSPVNHVVGVKISQSLKSTMGDCSYFHLLQRFLVN